MRKKMIECVLTYFLMMVFPEMMTPETIALELIDPCIKLHNDKWVIM